jgi:hypothetical protein
MAVVKIQEETNKIDIRAVDGYKEVLEKAIEYDRVITIAQGDKNYNKFFDTKEAFKCFCVDAYRSGMSPIELLNFLQLDGDITYTKGSTKQRAQAKILKFYDKLEKHMEDPVMFTADKLNKATLKQLYKKLGNIYDVLREYVIQKDDYTITQQYFHDVKKGDEEKPGIVKSLKKNHPELVKTQEHADALKKALVEDGVENPKTLSKVDTIKGKIDNKKPK